MHRKNLMCFNAQVVRLGRVQLCYFTSSFAFLLLHLLEGDYLLQNRATSPSSKRRSVVFGAAVSGFIAAFSSIFSSENYG